MTEPPQIEANSNVTAEDEPVYFCFSASLRIFGDNLDIDEITRILGITPTHSHRKGEQRSQGDSPWPHDMWCFEPAVDERQPLHEHIMELWEAVRSQIPYLRGLKHKYHVDVFGSLAENNLSGSFPVVVGTKNDGFPEKLRVRGVISELSFAELRCGHIFSSGTIKIRLFDKIKNYPQEYVFLVVPCFLDLSNEEKYLNHAVNLEISKLRGEFNVYERNKKKPCYFESITNSIDSHGVPFYCSKSGLEVLKNDEKISPKRK